MKVKRNLIFLSFVLFLSTEVAFTQNETFTQDFRQFRQKYLKTNKTGMWILGSWAVGNMLFSGAMLAFTKPQNEQKYFHQMNIMWNTVNLGLAGAGLYQNYRADEQVAWQAVLADHHQMQKILLFNAGLDIGYVMTGFFLRERAKTASKLPERLRGWGNSLILQGAFLFVFDVGLTIAHGKNGSHIQKILEKVQITSTENGIGLVYFLR
ncbi:MAG: hypothetical protein RMJ97_07755 [Raineya sp.]|nr:hypothetical protein [Raineya sp.]